MSKRTFPAWGVNINNHLHCRAVKGISGLTLVTVRKTRRLARLEKYLLEQRYFDTSAKIRVVKVRITVEEIL